MVALGDRAPDFKNLLGVDGKTYSTSSFLDKQFLVLVFFGNGCPTCNATEERLMTIQADYSNKGVQILLINSNNSSLSPPDTIAAMTKRANDVNYNFPYMKDQDREFARSMGAITTPHAFVLDRDRKLRYKGRVDNARQKSRVTINDVKNTLDELLATNFVTTGETESFGCSIVW